MKQDISWDWQCKYEGKWDMPYQQTNATVQFQYFTGNYVTWQTAQTAGYANSWIDQTTCTYTIATNCTYYGTPDGVYQVPETEEQRIEREQKHRDWEAKEKARRQRALEVLLTVLSKEQREQFEKDQCFEVKVCERLYRVKPGTRVARLDPQSKEIESWFCIHPELVHDLPSEDVALSQKLLLEANEKEFLRLANETKVKDRADCTPDEWRNAQIAEEIAEVYDAVNAL